METGRVGLVHLMGESKERRLRDQLARLAAEGLITLPSITKNRRLTKPIVVKGTPVSQLLLEDRR